MFWLDLANVGRGVPSRLMAAATTLARARAMVKSMAAARSIPSMAWHRCTSARHRGLHARQPACHDVESPAARSRSTEHVPVLSPPPSRLAVEWGGAPSSAEVPQSAP
jgi:hypothetical protein